MTNRRLTVLILVLAISLIGHSSYMQAKAWLAQRLINASWQQAMTSGEYVKPWPWADTWPVSRIIMPQHDVDLVILAGDDGRTLAFGPGARLSAPMPGEKGLSMISAHRDSYFEFLEKVTVGEYFTIQNASGDMLRYRISSLQIVSQPLLAQANEIGNESRIVLVTCYPFHALNPGGPQRYLVFAEPDKNTTQI